MSNLPGARLRFEVGVDDGLTACYVEIDGETVGELWIGEGPELHIERGMAVWHITVPAALGDRPGTDEQSFVMRTLDFTPSAAAARAIKT